MKLGLLLLLLLLLLLKLKHGSPSRRTLLHARIRNRLRNHEAFLSDKHDPRHSVKAFCRICSTNFRVCFKCLVSVFGRPYPKPQEAVKRNYTKRIPSMDGNTYTERLEAFNLESLELRRLKADMILTYKIIFGLVDLHAEKFFKLLLATPHAGMHSRLFLNILSLIYVSTLLLREFHRYETNCH